MKTDERILIPFEVYKVHGPYIKDGNEYLAYISRWPGPVQSMHMVHVGTVEAYHAPEAIDKAKAGQFCGKPKHRIL